MRSDSPDSGGGGYFTLSDSDGAGGADSPSHDEDDKISNTGVYIFHFKELNIFYNLLYKLERFFCNKGCFKTISIPSITKQDFFLLKKFFKTIIY